MRLHLYAQTSGEFLHPADKLRQFLLSYQAGKLLDNMALVVAKNSRYCTDIQFGSNFGTFVHVQNSHFHFAICVRNSRLKSRT